MEFFYDLEIIFAKLDEAELKLEEIRKKEQSSTVKTHKYIRANFALGVYYSKDVPTKENSYFFL